MQLSNWASACMAMGQQQLHQPSRCRLGDGTAATPVIWQSLTTTIAEHTTQDMTGVSKEAGSNLGKTFTNDQLQTHLQVLGVAW